MSKLVWLGAALMLASVACVRAPVAQARLSTDNVTHGAIGGDRLEIPELARRGW